MDKSVVIFLSLFFSMVLTSSVAQIESLHPAIRITAGVIMLISFILFCVTGIVTEIQEKRKKKKCEEVN